MDDGGEVIAGGVDLVSEGAEGVEEGGLGAFVHAGDAADAVGAGAEADEGGEEAGGGAGVFDMEFEGCVRGAALGDGAAEAGDGERAVGWFEWVVGDGDCEAEAAQAIGHGDGVLAPESAAEFDGA